MTPTSEYISVAAENNKFRKVLVEKIRRDRINDSIEQLRILFNETLQISEDSTNTKLDKADILELAVSLLRHKALSRANSSYARGFSHCLQETLRHVTLHTHLQPTGTEAVQRFYVHQRSRVTSQPGQISHKSTKRSVSRSTAALWRPWKNN